jgi:hypothetical protein
MLACSTYKDMKVCNAEYQEAKASLKKMYPEWLSKTDEVDDFPLYKDGDK